MKKQIEIYDLKTLERELTNQNFRYQLALKDGAVDSIIAEVIYRIAYLEERIQKLTKEADLRLTYSKMHVA